MINKLIIVFIACIILYCLFFYEINENFYPYSNSKNNINNIKSLDTSKIQKKHIQNTKIQNMQFQNTHIENTKIPKILIQTWKNEHIPLIYLSLINSVKKYNPDYTYMLFTDDDIVDFLKNNYPNYYETYLKLPVVIQKIDFFRYVAIYHYGGFYLDLDIKCLQSFDLLLDELDGHDAVFPIDMILTGSKCKEDRLSSYCEQNIPYMIGQFAFAAKPNHPFIRLLVDNIHNRIDYIVDTYHKLKNKKNHNFVYTTTGPDYVTTSYYQYKGRDSIKILEHKKNQYFGDYAKHVTFGTWK